MFGPVLFMDNLLTDWARPSIVEEAQFVYAHRDDLRSSWISLDDVARIMIHALDRPDLEGAWMNIGGPQRLRPAEVAEALSEAMGRAIRYTRCSEDEFGWRIASSYGDSMSADEKRTMAEGISKTYQYNNSSAERPFEILEDAMFDRIPIELETFSQWAKRQDWNIVTRK